MAGGRVLIVDDDPRITGLLRLALQRAGYSVRTANSGRDGLRAALEESPDVMILDVYMPDMSGDQVLREMTRHPRLSRVPVILATGEVDEPPAVTGFSLLHKPFSLEELYTTVRRAIAVP